MAFNISRRGLIHGSAALAAASTLGLPRHARGASGERKFLFLFAGGGWDTAAALEPKFNTDGVDMDPDTYEGVVGNLRFTAGEDRPSIQRFFERWGQRAAIINGIDTHSVGHESATQFQMTGTSASSYPDWPTLLAASSPLDYSLPHLVFSGPSYPGNYGSVVVRAGGGTLLSLLDGSILGQSDAPAPRPTTPADSIVDAFVYERTTGFANGRRGLARERSEGLVSSVQRSMELEGRLFESGLTDLGGDLLDQCLRAVETMRLGLTRCAMVGIPGGWDSHGDNSVQGPQLENLFFALDRLMEHMASTPGYATRWLIDEVVVVAMSEFGRTPKFNGSGGKDHWPYTSMMVAGSGVRGNQTLGLTDGGLIAQPIDLSTGQGSSSGAMLASEHVGTALLTLGGIDPATHLPGVPVLEALLR